MASLHLFVDSVCAVRGACRRGRPSLLPLHFLSFFSEQDTERASQVYHEALKLVPHERFTFGKVPDMNVEI